MDDYTKFRIGQWCEMAVFFFTALGVGFCAWTAAMWFLGVLR